MNQKSVKSCLHISSRTICKIIAVFSIFFWASCNSQSNNTSAQNIKQQTTGTEYKWTELTANAAFPKGYNFQILTVRDTLWALHHEGAWFSTDGKNWTKSPLTNIIKNNGFLDYVWFKDALYGLGTFDGNIEHDNLNTQIAKTMNFKDWQILSINSNLPKRFFYHPFVFKNKIWVIGGTDGKTIYSDAWTSEDAIHWTKIADNLPFGNKPSWNGQHFIIFKKSLFRFDNDVWVSKDGLNWDKVIDKIAKEPISGYSPIIYDDKIWLIGCNRDGVFSSEVTYSNDGRIWKAEKASWTPRGGATTCIYKGKVFMTGGKYGGLTKDGRTTEFVYSNDVWTFEKKE
jgi:hypothetical protein